MFFQDSRGCQDRSGTALFKLGLQAPEDASSFQKMEPVACLILPDMYVDLFE